GPAARLSRSRARGVAEPMPEEPKLAAAPAALSFPIRPLRSRPWYLAPATIACGLSVTKVSGAKSLAGSNGRFLYRLTLLACVPGVARHMVLPRRPARPAGASRR